MSEISKEKHPLNEDSNEKNKKVKLFSGKVFRNELKSGNRTLALIEFLNVIKDMKKHEYILDYLESGGSCMELIHILEIDSTIQPALVFEILSLILLKLNTLGFKYQNSLYQSCQYLLKNFITTINKMISLSSTTAERKSCLKLLTAISTNSGSLSRDVLLQVNFHTANVELLTKHVNEEDSVRDCFVRFIMSFLITGNYSTLSLLLEKKGLVGGIVPGLKFDKCETVCLVLTAMRNHILENVNVSKTSKMKVFNTAVMKEIVNLYNWKGPGGMKKNGKDYKVDEIDKLKVNQCVHEFLLTLCSSHKFGVIFKDPTLGFGKKTLNPLMYTVLDSLDRPWDHSYASDLVIQICKSCPDLVKTIWRNLAQFLEPRLTEKWLNAMNFAINLIKELNPDSIKNCVQEPTFTHYYQVVFLIAPLPLLKVVIPEDKKFDSLDVKFKVLNLVLEMLKSLENFLNYAKNCLTQDDFNKFKSHITKQVTRNFPNCQDILSNTTKIDDITYYEIIFNIFDKYKNLSKVLLEDVSNENALNLVEILENLESSFGESSWKLQIKIIEIFFEVHNTNFQLNSQIICRLLKFYYNGENCFELLENMFYSTGIFDDCEYEIKCWLMGVLNLKHFDLNVCENLVKILEISHQNLNSFLQDLTKIKNEINSYEFDEVGVKERSLSPMVLGLEQFMQLHEMTKPMKVYINFVLLSLLHSQTNSDLILHFLQKFNHNLISYASNWARGEETVLSKVKGKFGSHFEEFNHAILYENFTESDAQFKEIKLDMMVFYLTNLIKNEKFNEILFKNFENYIKYLFGHNLVNDTVLNRIFLNKIFFQQFSLLSLIKNNIQKRLTQFLIDLFKQIKHGDNEKYLNVYKEKILIDLNKIIKKPNKYNIDELNLILEVFNIKSDELLTELSSFLKNYQEKSTVIFNLIVYCFKQTSSSLDANFVKNTVKYWIYLNESNDFNTEDMSLQFLVYLKEFPHTIKKIDQNLFFSLTNVGEYKKSHVDLINFMLKIDERFLAKLEENLDEICGKKWLILNLLESLPKNENLLRIVYTNLESVILKTLEKPQKSNQHIKNCYLNVKYLITEFMSLTICENYVKKVQKFEVTEIFHFTLLKTVYEKLINSGNLNEKQLNVIILTCVHYILNLFKKNNNCENFCVNFNEILDKISELKHDFDLLTLTKNESLNLYFKYALKFGVSNQPFLIQSLTKLTQILSNFLENSQVELILEMLMSHSEFLDGVLGKSCDLKLRIWELFRVLVGNWGVLMKREHIPILLASYNAMVDKCDGVVLDLLKMYEENSAKTKFYDFKPFLWGKSASMHYSIRSTQNMLSKQPKPGDVLNILQEHLVKSTIVNHPLERRLRQTTSIEKFINSYDLTFLLPIFSQILAPEQNIATYKFTKSGALSLTVAALSCDDIELRKLAGYVLSRFYFHVEARQSGKDNLIWLRYVEVVCKGLKNLKLNNFSSIYLAKMALILTNPNDVMYIPLSQHLTAKSLLDFSTVPELYTLLHSPDVNFKEHRNFILDLIKIGMRSEGDFKDFYKSMGFKLVSELFNSCLCSFEEKCLILDIIEKMTNIELGVKILCENHSLLVQLKSMLKFDQKIVRKIVLILLNLVKSTSDYYMVYVVIKPVLKCDDMLYLISECRREFFELMHVLGKNLRGVLNVENLLEKSGDEKSKYFYKYKICNDLDFNDDFYYLKLLALNK